jgi:hypothetical protein
MKYPSTNQKQTREAELKEVKTKKTAGKYGCCRVEAK